MKSDNLSKNLQKSCRETKLPTSRARKPGMMGRGIIWTILTEPASVGSLNMSCWNLYPLIPTWKMPLKFGSENTCNALEDGTLWIQPKPIPLANRKRVINNMIEPATTPGVSRRVIDALSGAKRPSMDRRRW